MIFPLHVFAQFGRFSENSNVSGQDFWQSENSLSHFCNVTSFVAHSFSNSLIDEQNAPSLVFSMAQSLIKVSIGIFRRQAAKTSINGIQNFFILYEKHVFKIKILGLISWRLAL